MQDYVIINEDSFEKARKLINEAKKKNPKKLIGFTSINNELNQKILEKESINIFIPLLFHRKDYSKQRDSGFNQVMAKLAKKKNILIGINFEEITSSEGIKRAKILARIKQNIFICKKNKLKMSFIGTAKMKKQDLLSLGLVLGMPTNMLIFN